MLEMLRKMPAAERRLLLHTIRYGVKLELLEMDAEADSLWRHKMKPLYSRYTRLRPYLRHFFLFPDRWKMLEMMTAWVAELETACEELQNGKE
ncbi:MAG: hypothetical protein IJJ33_11425 [Victivallales bacterium]|nr:hypothetical protein [Victivallales bacterium]